MQKASREFVYSVHSAQNRPQITVEPGEEFVAETELCSGGWLRSVEDMWSADKVRGLNPCVCVAVEGARPGMLLAVDILHIEPDALGYTGFHGSTGALANKVLPRDWGYHYKTVRIQDGLVHWSDALKLPVRPMLGTLGTAPANETLSNAKGGPHGGNMDVQEVRAGSTVYLPVEVEGALLHIGDAHALQGDGEINGAGGIECRAEATLRTRLIERPQGLDCVRAEDDAHIMAIACERSIEESFYTATRQVLLWMTQDYAFSQEEAYLLMGQALVCRIAQMVNPTRSVIVKMPKAILGRAI